MKRRPNTFARMVLTAMSLGASLTTSYAQETTSFPTTGLLPKTEIGALDFIENNPKADGRGIIVAVLDTGVDPGAPGMQLTTTGAPKIIGVIDATGSGDVDTTTVHKMKQKGLLTGLTGRELTIGKKWKNPSGEFHMGKAAAYYLFPEELIPRIVKERKKNWNTEQRKLERQLQADITAYKTKFPSPNAIEKEKLEDLKKRLEAAKSFAEKYKDSGPIYDCVVFHDGKTWRVVVDTDADGDLAEEKVLANFDEEFEYGTFGDDSLMNFAVNVYNEGNLLSIVLDTGMHGTHVAGIVGAHFKDQPELNGVAPGAQIVSIKIGDTRIGGMETPHALSRAAIAIKKYGCDMVNMSYGEAIRFPREGNLIEKLSSLVDDNNIVYVSSAGNSGPALTTVGAPGGTTSAIIGVGATVTPELMKTSYSMLKDLPETQFTWSSRGPTIDGDLGVDISAPGGAIAPIPRWELSKNMRANGTSMAGPDACGGLALVLSALKQEEKKYTAIWVKRAAMHAAREIPGVDVFGQGHGMIQVGATYEILKNMPDSLLKTPRFNVSVGRDKNRGIYLRNGDLNDTKHSFSVSVKPKFSEDTKKEIEADFEARYVVNATENWVNAPQFVFVNSLSKRFDVQVNVSGLKPGVHYAEIQAVDTSYPEAGPAFRVPVTVVVPTELALNEWKSEETLESGQIKRFFYQVPTGATWAEIKVKAPELEETTTLVVHPQHVIPGERYVNVGDSYYLSVSKDHPKEQTFPVIEGATIELALAQYWSEMETATFDIELKFHGLKTELGDGVFAQGEKGEEFRVVSMVETSVLSPTAKFTELHRSIAAESAEIKVKKGDRDQLEKDGEAYHDLVLQYPFTLDENVDVTPRFNLLNDKIYEIEFESQLQMIFDANKQLLATDDTFPSAIHLKKGDYVLRLQLRHKERKALEALKTLNLTLAIALESPISTKTYRVTDHALLKNGKSGSKALVKNTRTPLVVTEPHADKLPKFAKAGDRLKGSLKLQKGSPVSIPLQWIYNGNVFSEKEDQGPEDEIESTYEEDVSNALLKLAASYRKDQKKESFDKLLKNQLASSPQAIEVALEQLRWDVETNKDGERHTQINKSANAILELIDQDELAKYYGRNHQMDDTQSKALSKKMKLQKDAVIEAYSAIASASAKGNADLETLQSDLKNLKVWAGDDELEKAAPGIQKAIYTKQGYDGENLMLLNNAIEKDIKDKSSYEARIELLTKLGWEHIVKYEEDWMLRRFPCSYVRF